MIERKIWKWEMFELPDYIQFRIIPGLITLGKIDADIFRVRKQGREAALSGAGIEHALPCRNLRRHITNEFLDGGFKGIQTLIQT
jgi:hypothetical protein